MTKCEMSPVDVSHILESSQEASISGVITSISPMKRSKNSPFLKEPAISDGKSSMRVFEFNTNVRRRLANFEKTREHVILEGCEIKHSRVNKDLEIMVTSHTTLTKL